VFELQIALKYLIPRKRSVSTALISILSLFVISLVIWLVLVFLSVTSGMEANWLKKLTALHAPIRIAPTDTYYSSYYYQIDRHSAASNYTLKTIGEKLESPISDPYAKDVDPELPPLFPETMGIDPVKIASQELEKMKKEIAHFSFQDYEISGALLKIQLQNGASLSQMTYLLSFCEKNPTFSSLLLDKNSSQENESPIFLPKSYRDHGAKIGDLATLNFSAPSLASFQEQRIWGRVANFYDPGMFAVGSKCILVPKEITRAISAASPTVSPDGTATNGIFVWIEDLSQTQKIADQIHERFEKAGISSYWQVTTYKDFPFSKDLLLQFQSDRMILLFVASLILTVACSSIISLLILLVNDKKKEIAILQSMGASKKSIAAVFAICGVTLGAFGCLFGSLAAFFTLHHIDRVIALFSFLQGHAALNPAFFGSTLPNKLSPEALLFVLIATPILSFLAGMIPALKASRIHPASTLRSE